MTRGRVQTRKYQVQRLANGWAVLDPDGARIGLLHSTKESAMRSRDSHQRRADRARRAVVRPCMCCGHPFASEGIHNRLCTDCRRQSADHDAWGPTPGRARHGKR